LFRKTKLFLCLTLVAMLFATATSQVLHGNYSGNQGSLDGPDCASCKSILGSATKAGNILDSQPDDSARVVNETTVAHVIPSLSFESRQSAVRAPVPQVSPDRELPYAQITAIAGVCSAGLTVAFLAIVRRSVRIRRLAQ